MLVYYEILKNKLESINTIIFFIYYLHLKININ